MHTPSFPQPPSTRPRHNDSKPTRVRPSPPGPHAIFRGHRAAVTSSVFLTPQSSTAPSAQFLATGDASGLVHIWDTEIEESLLSLRLGLRTQKSASPNHSTDRVSGDPVIGLAEDPFHNHLYVQHKSGLLSVFSLSRGAATDTVRYALHSPPPAPRPYAETRVAESFCGVRVAAPGILVCAGTDEAAGMGTTVDVLDARCGRSGETPRFRAVVRMLEAAAGRRMAMCVAPVRDVWGGVDNGTVVAGYEDGSIATWDVRAPNVPRESARVGAEAVVSVALSPRGGCMALAGGAGREFVAVCGGEVVRRRRVAEKGTACVAWREDGKVVATAGWDGKVRLWDGRRQARSLLRPLGALRGHRDGAQTVSFAGDTGVLASGGKDRTVALWKVYPAA